MLRPVEAAAMMKKVIRKLQMGLPTDAIVVYDPAMKSAFAAEGYKDFAVELMIGNTVKTLTDIKHWFSENWNWK